MPNNGASKRSTKRGLLLWLPFVMLVAAIGIVLLRGCALVFPVTGWNFCPGSPGAMAAELQRNADLDAQAKQLELELQKQKLACVSQAPPPPAPIELPNNPGPEAPQQVMVKPPEPPPPLPEDRWANKDLGLLDGCWILGKDTTTRLSIGARSELCTVKAGRICFNGGKGQGQRSEQSICPSIPALNCNAPITASFRGDNLHTTQPEVKCEPSSTRWLPNTMDCRRVSDTLALCRSSDGFEHEFRRAK